MGNTRCWELDFLTFCRKKEKEREKEKERWREKERERESGRFALFCTKV